MAKRKRETKPVMISQGLLNSYRSQVDKQGDRAAQFMEQAIGTYMKKKPDATVAQVREFTYELMQSALPNFTDLSETLSCEFMEMLASKYGWDDVRPELFDTTDYELVNKKLHYLAGSLTDGDVRKFKKDVSEITKFYVKRAAQESMMLNCNKAKVRFARVPTGFETCSFCFMLSSRGFVYSTEEVAGSLHKFHVNCDCIVVPGAKGRTKIDGYDPQGMYERYEACENAIGGLKQSRKTWETLSESDIKEYVDRADGDKAEAFKAFHRNRVFRELETRDWHWLYTGEAPKVTYLKPKEALEPHEQRAIDNLQRNGFRLTVNAEDPAAKANIDLTSERNGYLWELKDVTSARSVSNQIRRARKKWYKLKLKQLKRIVLSVGENAVSFDELLEEVKERIKEDEEIVLISDSEIKRIKK